MSDLQIHSSQPAARGELHRFFLLPGKAARRLALGVGILAASLGFALVAASQSRPDLIAAGLGLPAAAPSAPREIGASSGTKAPNEIKTPIGMISLADLQRRGNSLVGEIRTQDGAVTRLVLDARTHALIGMRVIHAAEQAQHKLQTARACPDPSPVAPMPGTLLPATPLRASASPAN